MTTTQLACKCGKVHLDVQGRPFITTECHCNSCREAAQRLGGLPGAPAILADNGGTPFILYRKDRAHITQGAEHLKAFRLTPKSVTRRIVATCCNTPMFLEFKGGHWMSIYAALWPEADRPAMTIRTMTADRNDLPALDDSIPSGALHTAGFFAKLFGVWAAMGFRSPEVIVHGEINA